MSYFCDSRNALRISTCTRFFPAFTDWEELRKLCGPKNQQTLVLSFDDYAGMVLNDNNAAGFVLDPFGACLSFDRTMIGHLVARKQSKS